MLGRLRSGRGPWLLVSLRFTLSAAPPNAALHAATWVRAMAREMRPMQVTRTATGRGLVRDLALAAVGAAIELQAIQEILTVVRARGKSFLASVFARKVAEAVAEA